MTSLTKGTDTNTAVTDPPLVVHVIYRLAVGGLENGLVNLINRMAPERYRHAIVCIDDYTDFRERIQREDVEVYALHKKPGTDLGAYVRFWKLMRRLRPAIVHTRNLGALEFQLPAWLAGVRYRIQGEHGRDTGDLHGTNRKYLLFRKMLRPLVTRYVALSQDLANWLKISAGVAPQKISQIYNGVDTERFYPPKNRLPLPADTSGVLAVPHDGIIIGTIGRMQPEKNQLMLVRSFITLLETVERGRERLRLVLIGDGPLREEAQVLLREANAENLAWLPGSRNDAPEMMQMLDIFVLPSLIEGVSNTILEAMATGLPVVATEVGGNAELVTNKETGLTVSTEDETAMSQAIQRYINDPALRQNHGKAGRLRVEKMFSMDSMVNGYVGAYDHVRGISESTAELVRDQ